jgi:hypothetical protein
MSRFIIALTAALACATVAQAQEAQTQETRTKTEVKGGQMVSYTGCVQSGSEERSFILDKVVPITRTTTTEEVGTSGTITRTVTRYVLVPDQQIQLVEHVGHKVEVTGILTPAGTKETKTKTEIEREHGKDTTITEKTKGDGDMPRFRVVSIKPLGESCQ